MKMKFVQFQVVFLQYTVLCVLCLLIGCSDNPKNEHEIQPAQLIKASSFDAEGDSLESDPLPLNGRGTLGVGSVIELVFDKPVLAVSINFSTKAKPDDVPPATVWTLAGNRLDVWNYLQIGYNPERDVSLEIIYEDETGIHKNTLNVTLGGYHIDVFPPVIDDTNVWNNQVNVDATRLNREGIKFSFDTEMDVHRTKIEVYNDQAMLDWTVDCWKDRNKTVILLPESEDDWLLPGREYEIHLVDFYDFAGTRGDGLEDGPIVISFQTASEE